MDYFRQKKLKKACASYRSTSEFVRWEDVRSILLIYDSDFAEQNQNMRITIDRIEHEGKKVTECMFVDKKRAITSSIEERVIVDRKEIDFLGRPQGIAVRQLMENGQFDIVIDTSQCFTMKYIVMAVKAKMKCGRQNDDKICDLQIEGDMEQEQLVAEVVRYLTMINK